MRRVIDADPRSARRTEPTGLASSTCANTARAGTGGRCPLRAGPSGLLACMRSHRKPVPDEATARSARRRSRSRQASLPRQQSATVRSPRAAGVGLGHLEVVTGVLIDTVQTSWRMQAPRHYSQLPPAENVRV